MLSLPWLLLLPAIGAAITIRSPPARSPPPAAEAVLTMEGLKTGHNQRAAADSSGRP